MKHITVQGSRFKQRPGYSGAIGFGQEESQVSYYPHPARLVLRLMEAFQGLIRRYWVMQPPIGGHANLEWQQVEPAADGDMQSTPRAWLRSAAGRGTWLAGYATSRINRMQNSHARGRAGRFWPPI